MADFARSGDPAVQVQLDRLGSSIYAGDRLGLERIAALLDRLGRPQDRLPPVLHVAGTNGKGSACAFLRSALEAAGHKVHVFTSPHLVRFNERIRIGGKLIEDAELAASLAETLDASGGIDPSFFEATAAAAFLAFARTSADACIIEVGLGGRLDATNVVEAPLVCGIAGLGLDHQSWLGNRLADIAGEKAGIAKRGSPLVTQLYPRSAAGRIGQIAHQVGAPWLPRGGRWDAIVSRDKLRYRDFKGELSLPVPRLPGRHQAMNAALAIAMLRHQQALDVPPSAFNAAMGWADWPARLQKLEAGPLLVALPAGSEFWVDGGHNPAAARQVSAYVRKAFAGTSPLHMLFACLTSKDAGQILAPFAGLGAIIHTLPIADHDSRDPECLAEMARAQGFTADDHATLGEALAHIAATAEEPVRILSFGSLYLAGEVLAANNQAPD
jgi:dihydrofolate synthase / folylpolyglutamate synthase